MTVFITGGCKNGKSTFALKAARGLAGGGLRYYVATMIPCDSHEWECVRRHRAARAGMGFETLEQGTDLSACLRGADVKGTFLLDSVTALLVNEMFPPGGGLDRLAAARVGADLERFLDTVENAVLVSDYLCGDGGVYDGPSEQYRRGLAGLERLLARRCDCVVEICVGLPVVQKGRLPDFLN